MTSIIKGTTPTIQFTFNYIHPTDIEVAYLTVKQNKTVILEKDITEATVGENTISWKLEQEDTLSFALGKVGIMHNWRLFDGTRGASKEAFITVDDNHKDEVI